MNDWKAMYQEKRKTPEEVAKLFHAGDICLSNGQITEPIAILHALADRAEREGLTGIRHYLLLPMRNQKYMAAGMEAHIRHVSHFVSGFDREAIWEGRSDYLPSHYSQVPVLWKQVLEGPDVFYCTVSPMDRHGYFSCGTAADLSEIRKKARRLFLEVNPTMPRTFGSHIHISEVDALVESDLPITEVPPAPISKDDQIIGGMIAQEICDGATLQLGIVDLTNAGVITNDRKKIHRGKTIVTFTFGARSTYDFIDDNPGVEFLPVDYVNDPFVIAQNDNVISINSCMEIDLFGQVCSETIGPKNFSGAGGQVDFIRGAAASKGGKSFLAFKSAAKNDTISKIKPVLTEGSCVTTTRNDVDYIVTEQGMVRLKGLTCSERAKALIGIAHPNFREELTRAAQKMHLIV